MSHLADELSDATCCLSDNLNLFYNQTKSQAILFYSPVLIHNCPPSVINYIVARSWVRQKASIPLSYYAMEY